MIMCEYELFSFMIHKFHKIHPNSLISYRILGFFDNDVMTVKFDW